MIFFTQDVIKNVEDIAYERQGKHNSTTFELSFLFHFLDKLLDAEHVPFAKISGTTNLLQKEML